MQNEIIELRKKGMGYREIAEAMNCTKATVVYYCRKSNLGGVRGNGALSGNQYITSYESVEVTFEKNFNNSYKGKFVYVKGYKGAEKKFTMRCIVCGIEQERTANLVRHKRTIKCSACALNNSIANKEILKQSRAIESDKRKADREIARIKRDEERRAKKNETIECTCLECGDKFNSLREKKYCSHSCMEHYNNSTKKHTKRKRVKLNGRVERISLPMLIKRDNNICYLCGGECDYNDKRMNENGLIVYGRNYPSVDHLIPVSKGGTETWDNVKLAHCYCNSIKSDKSNYIMNKGKIALNLFGI